ncbi:IclR family transcriptional regulator [Streptosporangium sp. NBC_01755]|uniref:IclR family transcriptional regulator n=1 Tax=unclassified Streptosporangium TaxID=2632669 RepID=UPI002DD85253|nr:MULTISPECIES: IclR family transcriptional regulator [unclassified Streptosporangium]WSA26748.1 IclR family transcriptional regulator [Streptosporangium sp. NBC_01810]WSD01827.1 IclR family transcriptional regulator [Streptosporangium sp. NBC_01755]
MTDDKDRAPAVTRAFTVLSALAQGGPSVLADIVEKTGINKSTVFYILRTLTALEAVDYDERMRTYRLGPALLELGAAASSQFGELSLARRYLGELLERLMATIVIYRRVSTEEISLLDKLERPNRVRITLQPGERIPIQGGSFGRAFLAYEDPASLEVILRHGLQAFTPKSLTDVAAFRQELDLVRERGWAVDHEGYALGISTVAAPIFDADGRVTLVVAAVGFSNLIDDDTAAEYGVELRQVCDRIGEANAQSRQLSR